VGLPAEIQGERRSSILVVDDERGPREALRLIFERTYDVTVVDSGERAVEALRRERIDLVTLDLKMPGMSGVETLAAIREIDPEVDVIVVTGFGSYDTAIEAMRLHAFDFLTKPFDVGRVLSTVARAVERRKSRARRSPREEIDQLIDQLLRELDELEIQIASRLTERDRTSFDRVRLFAFSLRDELEHLVGKQPPTEH
jgi:DNA-binding NtrC family response regulator